MSDDDATAASGAAADDADPQDRPSPPPASPAPPVIGDPWADTSVLVPPPTAVDPLVPPPPAPPPAPAPGWSSPSGPVPPTSAPPSAAPPATAPPAAGGPLPPPAPSWTPAPSWSSGPADPGAAPPHPSYPSPGGPALPGVAGWGAIPVAPKPGVIPLRPLGVGEILDGAISYIRRDPRPVLGISGLIAVATALLQLGLYAALSSTLGPLLTAIDRPTTGGGSSAEIEQALNDLAHGAIGLAGVGLAITAITYVLNVLATGLLTTAMGRAVLGRPVSTSDVWQRAASRFWPLLGVSVLLSLIVAAAVSAALLVAVLVGYVLAQAAGDVAGVLVGLLVAAVALGAVAWLYVLLLLSPVALVLEGVGPVASLRRSVQLVRGAWWRTFGIHLLAVIIAAVVSQVITVPFGIVSGLLSVSSAGSGGTVDPFSFGQSLVTALSTLITTTLVVPFSAGVLALLYVDRRIRREALDIELARAAGVARTA